MCAPALGFSASNWRLTTCMMSGTRHTDVRRICLNAWGCGRVGLPLLPNALIDDGRRTTVIRLLNPDSCPYNSPIMIHFEHTAYNVHDPERVAAWYVEHLDMDIVRAQKDGLKAHFVADKHRRFCWEFYCNPVGAIPDQHTINAYTQHVAFAVEDMTAARTKLLAAGCTADGDVTTSPARDKLSFLRDPWGLCLQLVRRAGTLY